MALRARDDNGGGFVFDCSAHTRTCLLGNIIAYTPYAFDINNFVYAHLNNLAQEAPDVKPFEEMSPHEWASALEDTVKQFVYRIVKYREGSAPGASSAFPSARRPSAPTRLPERSSTLRRRMLPPRSAAASAHTPPSEIRF